MRNWASFVRKCKHSKISPKLMHHQLQIINQKEDLAIMFGLGNAKKSGFEEVDKPT